MAILDEFQDAKPLLGTSEGGNATVFLGETTKNEDKIQEENQNYSFLYSHILSLYNRSKHKRMPEETKWLEDYRNYRGLYGPQTVFRDTEKARAFIKITKTKVHASYAQITDILLSAGKFPIQVRPSPVPTGDVAEAVYFDP